MFALAGTSSTETPTKRTGRLVLRSAIVVAFAAASVGMLAGPASAVDGVDTSGASTTANVAVTTAISLTGLTSSFTLTGIPGATVSTPVGGPVVLNVKTNNFAGYSVTVESRTTTMLGAIVGSANSIPIANLGVRETGSPTFAPMSAAAPVQVHTQSIASAEAGDNLSNDYNVLIPFVRPDTYTATLDYVATTL